MKFFKKYQVGISLIFMALGFYFFPELPRLFGRDPSEFANAYNPLILEVKTEALFETKSADAALEILEKYCCRSYPEAPNLIGLIYERRRDDKASLEKAIKYYEKAANLGLGQANYNLARLNITKKPENIDRAIRNLELAGQRGFAQGYVDLGHHYLTGSLVAQDVDKAIFYFKKAAVSLKAANINIGNIYLEGNGKKKDLKTAIEYLERGEAYLTLANIYLSGAHSVKPDINKAVEYLLSGGHYQNVALMYKNGEWGLKIDLKRAMQYYEMGASQKHLPSMYGLVVLFLQNDTLGLDKELMTQYLQYAADEGLARAKLTYGLALLGKYKKLDIKRDENRGYEYLRQAAELGDDFDKFSAVNYLLMADEDLLFDATLDALAERNLEIVIGEKTVRTNIAFEQLAMNRIIKNLEKNKYTKKEIEYVLSVLSSISDRVGQAALMIAIIERNRTDQQVNKTNMIKNLKKALALGIADAELQLALIYADNDLDMKNIGVAEKYFANAVDKSVFGSAAAFLLFKLENNLPLDDLEALTKVTRSHALEGEIVSGFVMMLFGQEESASSSGVDERYLWGLITSQRGFDLFTTEVMSELLSDLRNDLSPEVKEITEQSAESCLNSNFKNCSY